jgi:hypothetical protein
MNSSLRPERRVPAREFLPPYPPSASASATWREGAAVVGGILVLLTSAWLIWAALAEAAFALAATA